MKQDHFVPSVTEQPKRPRQWFQTIETITEQDDETAAFDRRQQLLENSSETGLPARFAVFQHLRQPLKALRVGRRLEPIADFRVEGD